MFTLRSLTAKSILIILIILVYIVIDVSSDIVFSRHMEGDATRMNLAGQLRFRSFEIAWITHRIIEITDLEKRKPLLHEARHEIYMFEKIMDGFKTGDRELGIRQIEYEEPLALLNSLGDEWYQTLKPLVLNAMEQPEKEALEVLRPYDARIHSYVYKIDRFVKLLEDDSKKELREHDIQRLFIIGFFVLISGVVIVFIRLGIVKPIRQLNAATKEIEKGDFDTSVAVRSKDEIGSLINTFNTMALTLKTLFDERTKRLQELDTLNKVATAANRSLALNNMLKLVVDAIMGLEHIAVEKGAIFTCDDRRKNLDLVASSGFSEAHLAACSSVRCGECLCGIAAENEEILISHSNFSDERHRKQYKGMSEHGHLLLPLKSGDTMLGVLCLYLSAGTMLSEKEINLYKSIADVISVSMQNAFNHRHVAMLASSLNNAQRIALLGNWDWDIANNELQASDEVHRIFCLPHPQSVATYDVFESFVHPDDREFVKKSMEDALSEGKPFSIDHRIVVQGDRVRFVHKQAEIVRDDSGRPIRMQGTMQDITDRKLAEKQIRLQLQRITTLRDIDMAIKSSLDLRVTLNIFLDQVTSQLHVDAANIFTLNRHTNMLEYVAGRGFRTQGIPYTAIRLGQGNAGLAALERRIVCIPNLKKAADIAAYEQVWITEDFIAYYAVPLIAKGNIEGILEVFHRTPFEPDPSWIDFLEALAGQAAIAIDNATLFNDLQRSNTELLLAYDTTIDGWSRALDIRDKETEGHSQRVADITLRIARTLHVSEAELVHMRRGALLHDIGKMSIPDRILFKPDRLNDEEMEIMKMHPVIAFKLLSPISFLRPAIDIPYCHHEAWDGTGYPRGLKGEQIPIAARIFKVVDVWDALISDRPYRPAWPEEKVREYLKSRSGIEFDPRVVDIFLQMMNKRFSAD